MDKTKLNQILLLGLPNTGKTSFLAALWYMVTQKNVECRLVFEKLDGDNKYLNQVRDAWLGYKPVPRNQLDVEKIPSMHLRNRATGKAVTLSLPDLSGESFKLQWTKRQFTIGYDKLLRESKSGAIFINPDGMRKPYRIDQVTSSAPSEQTSPHILPLPHKRWDIEETPTQVQLVELLQFISSRDYFQAPFRLAIIVSAWDLLMEMKTTPAEYIQREMPLLQQFLNANIDKFEVAIYGVSAQGGRYASPMIVGSMVKDAKVLANRLVSKADVVSHWIWDRLETADRTSLEKLKDSDQVRSIVVEFLNGVIARADLFDSERFGSIKLRSETRELLKDIQLKDLKSGIEIIYLNRMLLEDVYPEELSSEWQHHKEHSKLQRQLPARRISVVGNNLQNPHDITEPIQWLMQ
ncbi:MAG: hypothetical protein JWM68_3583 [Verrucomicrobiales bacterium]|nr:hypothetical protein [Verrucomicrobiales bacterium]